MASPSIDLEALIAEARGGDNTAVNALFAKVQGELREIAHALLRNERPGQTLQPTALVNEAFVRIIGRDGIASLPLESRAHLFGVFARAMRQILIDRARRPRRPVPLPSDSAIPSNGPHSVAVEELAQIAEVFDDFRKLDPDAARVVELKVFCGQTMDEIAELLGRSKRAIERDWTAAKLWIGRELRPTSPTPGH